MPNCTRCGAPLADAVEICPNCSTIRESVAEGRDSSALKQRKALILIAIAAIVIVVVAAIGSIIVLNALRASAENQVSIAVNSVIDPYTDPNMSSTAGKHLILLNVTMRSTQNKDFMMMFPFFSLDLEHLGSNMTVDALEIANQPVPVTLPRGESLTFNIGFEVPDGALLKKIHFHGILVSGEAAIP